MAYTLNEHILVTGNYTVAIFKTLIESNKHSNMTMTNVAKL